MTDFRNEKIRDTKWKFCDLSKEMLPYIKIDYISITCKALNTNRVTDVTNVVNNVDNVNDLIDSMNNVPITSKRSDEILEEIIAKIKPNYQKKDFTESSYASESPNSSNFSNGTSEISHVTGEISTLTGDTPYRDKSHYQQFVDNVISENINEEFKSTESKYLEKKYDLIFDDYNYFKNREHLKYARIPGEVADSLVRGLLDKKIFLDKELFTITRLDFKIDIPDFQYISYEIDSKRLLEFSRIQPADKYEKEDKKKYAIAYIGERATRRFIRTYVSGKQMDPKKVFEIECKRDCARRYGDFLLTHSMTNQVDPGIQGNQVDISNFNKTLILELIDTFSTIVDCRYTNPLLRWINTYVLVIKNQEFPQEKYYKRSYKRKPSSCDYQDIQVDEKQDKIEKQDIESRQEKSLPVKKEKREIQLRDIIAKKNNFLNADLISLNQTLDNEKSLQLMILCFCSKILSEKWKNKQNGVNEIRIRIQHWNHYTIEKEVFKNTDDYKIEFPLKDLLIFLNLTNRAETREKVIDTLKQIMDFKVKFWVGKSDYYQSFVYSLVIQHDKNRYRAKKVSLILHPFVCYNLLNNALLFDTLFLLDYYELLEKHKFNKNKRAFLSNYRAFICTLFSFKMDSGIYIKEMLKHRHLKKPELRQRQLSFIHDLIKLFSTYSNKDLGIITDRLKYLPVEYDDFFRIFNRASNAPLDDMIFIFQKRETGQITDQVQVSDQMSDSD